MNIVKIPPVLVKSLNTAIGHYLNDVYMVYDAAQEDHDLKEVQIKKAIAEYELETENSFVQALKQFKAALLTKYNIRSFASKSTTAKPLTKQQHAQIEKVVLENFTGIQFNKDDDVLTFFNFLNLTGLAVQFSGKFFTETCFKRKMERRVFLLKGEMDHYELSVQTYQRRLQEIRRLVLNAILAKLEIPEELWNRSMEFYGHDPLYAPQLYSLVNNLPFKQMWDDNGFYNEMKKQEIYDALIHIAEKKEDLLA